MIKEIRAPSQARSQRTMEEVYRALDELLKERSFDRITISDLATHADAAVGSIYARFKDKNSLLAGLHLKVSEEAINCLGPLSAVSKWEGASDTEMVEAIMKAINRFYRQRTHILRATLIANLETIDKMRTDVWEVAIEKFTDLLVARSPESDPAALLLAMKTIVRFTMAIMHQAIAVEWVDRWKGGVPRKLVLKELARFCVDVIARAKESKCTTVSKGQSRKMAAS